MKIRAADVLLGTVTVGRLTRDGRGRTSFAFLPSYQRLPGRPVLGQHFEDDLEKRYKGKGDELPPFFANLLPEGTLREVLEARLGVDEGDDLSLLAAVGDDLPGAVVVRPSIEGAGDESSALQSEDDEPPTSPHLAEQGFRFSLAGVQMKFSMMRRRDRLTLPGKNETGSWIVKLASSKWAGLCENEYSMLEWARATGFEVPDCELVPASSIDGVPDEYLAGGPRAFAIRRYDRRPSGRVHQEDFAQVVGLPPERKYDHVSYAGIGRLARALIGEDAFDEILRRLVFAIASGNNDAHLKNWSLVYPDGITARLAPLYDQVSTVGWTAPNKELALRIVWKRKFAEIDAAELRTMAERCGVQPDRAMAVVDETLEKLAQSWRRVLPKLPLLDEHRVALHRHWASVPLLRKSRLHELAPSISYARPRRPKRT